MVSYHPSELFNIISSDEIKAKLTKFINLKKINMVLACESKCPENDAHVARLKTNVVVWSRI